MLLNGSVLQVVEHFIRDFSCSCHGSAIAKASGLNQKTVSNVLNRLEEDGFLESRTVGKNKEFKLRFDDLERTKRFLLGVENARTLRFLEENPKVKEVFSKTSPFLKGIVLVFGSYAKGSQKKDSDLDVFIAGEYDASKLKQPASLYGIEVSVRHMSRENFRKALREKDLLIREVVSDHIILHGTEEYLEFVLGDYYGR